MEAQPLPAFISKKPKSIHPLTRQPLDLHSPRLSGGRMSCVLVAEKGALHTLILQCRLGRPAKCKSERGQRKWHPDLVMVAFWLPCLVAGAPPLACNLCSQAGTRQEQRPACAGQGPLLRRLLASPQVQLAQPTHLSCIVITASCWNYWSTYFE